MFQMLPVEGVSLLLHNTPKGMVSSKIEAIHENLSPLSFEEYTRFPFGNYSKLDWKITLKSFKKS
jgi:hypothetical protein